MTKQEKHSASLSEKLYELVTQEIDSGRISLYQLACKTDVPQPVLHRWVSGDRKTITLETADRLAEYFGAMLVVPAKKIT